MSKKVNKIPQKLERLLFTVARRYGIRNISLGVVLFSNGHLVLDSFGNIPNLEISGRNFNAALVDLVERIGISEFSISDYLGGFHYETETGEKAKKYYFLIDADLPDKLSKSFEIKHIDEVEFSRGEFKLFLNLMDKTAIY